MVDAQHIAWGTEGDTLFVRVLWSEVVGRPTCDIWAERVQLNIWLQESEPRSRLVCWKMETQRRIPKQLFPCCCGCHPDSFLLGWFDQGFLNHILLPPARCNAFRGKYGRRPFCFLFALRVFLPSFVFFPSFRKRIETAAAPDPRSQVHLVASKPTLNLRWVFRPARKARPPAAHRYALQESEPRSRLVC